MSALAACQVSPLLSTETGSFVTWPGRPVTSAAATGLCLLTQYADCRSESAGVFVLDEVNELLHDHVGFALPVLDVEHEPVPGQDVRVVVDVVDRHDGHRPQLGGLELGPVYRENTT